VAYAGIRFIAFLAAECRDLPRFSVVAIAIASYTEHYEPLDPLEAQRLFVPFRWGSMTAQWRI
jgi:hypothetical protein